MLIERRLKSAAQAALFVCRTFYGVFLAFERKRGILTPYEFTRPFATRYSL